MTLIEYLVKSQLSTIQAILLKTYPEHADLINNIHDNLDKIEYKSLSTSAGNDSANFFTDKYNLYTSPLPIEIPAHSNKDASSIRSGNLTALSPGGSS